MHTVSSKVCYFIGKYNLVFFCSSKLVMLAASSHSQSVEGLAEATGGNFSNGTSLLHIHIKSVGFCSGI
jgi:hypothetical protein